MKNQQSSVVKWLRPFLYIIGVLVLFMGAGLAMAWNQLGSWDLGSRDARARQSFNYDGDKFLNPVPTDNSFGPVKIWNTAKLYLQGRQAEPKSPIPIEKLSKDSFARPPASGLRLTWLGHSTTLVEMDGANILLDPVFSERASPLSFAGPKRFHPPPANIEDLPELDAVVISHDHFDHLDRDAILELAPKTSLFIVPLGVSAHLDYWGLPPEKIVELDWWEDAPLPGGVRVVSCPARHFSGRMAMVNSTQWASFALIGPKHRVFFTGDTGIGDFFKQAGKRLGPFDATLVKVGAYGNTWPDIHLNPEQGVLVHQLVRGNLMIPVHWGTFNLSYHAWTEPAERTLVAAEKSGVRVAVPRPGQSLEPADPPPIERWWPAIDWEPAEHNPGDAVK